MSDQSQLYYNLSKKEQQALKRQAEYETKKVDSRNHLIRRFAVIGLILVVIGFTVWWGVTKSSRQEAVEAKSTIGSIAPNFSLPDTTGEKISLSDYKGKKNVLIYFNEGLSCDPCIQQMPELEKYSSEFEKMNVVLLHVMYDQPEKLKDARKQYNIQSPMLSYYNANTENDYDLTRFSMAMGRRAGHTFVLVDTEGKIIWRKDYWPGYGMSVSNGKMFVDGKEVIENVKTVLNT